MNESLSYEMVERNKKVLVELYRKNPRSPEFRCHIIITQMDSDVSAILELFIQRMNQRPATLKLVNDDRLYRTTARLRNDARSFPVDVTIHARNLDHGSASIALPDDAINIVRSCMEES